MTSYRMEIPARRRTYVRLLGEVRHALNSALTEEATQHGLTKTEMARRIGCDKAFVTRKLTGQSNMTLETLADLAFALDRPVKISLPARGRLPGINALVSHVSFVPAVGAPGSLTSSKTPSVSVTAVAT